MRWRYGIIKDTKKHKSKEYTEYFIGEVYYTDDPNKATLCSGEGYFPSIEEEAIPQTEEQIIEGFKKEIQKILNDIEGNKIIDADGPFDRLKKKERPWRSL